MPDIIYAHSFVAGATTEAADVAENLFNMQGAGTNNLAIINGRLDQDNLAVVTPLITRQMVRPGAFFEGSSGGATANRDYFKQVYPAGWEATTVADAADAAVPVAGLCRTKRFNNTSALFCVSWGFSVIIDDGNEIGTNENDKPYGFDISIPTAGGHTSMHLYINGVRINNCNWFLRHSDTTLGQFDKGFLGRNDKAICPVAFHQDSRYIFGSFIIDSTNDGNYFTGDTADLNPLLPGVHTVELRVASKKRIVRFKSSNITILGMR